MTMFVFVIRLCWVCALSSIQKRKKWIYEMIVFVFVFVFVVDPALLGLCFD